MNSVLRDVLKTGFFALIFGLVLCSHVQHAEAQFKYHGLSITAGTRYTFNSAGTSATPAPNDLNARGYGVGIAYFDLGLEYQYRFANNWLVGVEAHVSFHRCDSAQSVNAGAVCERDVATPIMLTAITDIRYLILTDDFRPFVGVGVGYWQSLAFLSPDVALSSFGPTAVVGFEWFFAEELSLGLRIRYNLKLLVGLNNVSPFQGLEGHLSFTAYL